MISNFFILVYDITNNHDFKEYLNDRLNEILEVNKEKLNIILVGNKIDIE